MPNQPSEQSVNQAPKPVKGFTVVKLEVSADPEKGDDWLERQRGEYSKEDFEREFLLKPVGAQDSYPVFSDYYKDRHESSTLDYKRHLQYIYRGWDFGKVHPCVVFLQPEGECINIIYELYGTNIDLPPFARQVVADSGLLFPNAKFVDWGDASGVNERDNGRASIRLLREDFGITVRYYRKEVEEGITEMSKYLLQYSGNRPRLMVNPVRAPHVAEAMRGGYRRKPDGKIIKDGEHDHPVDAARYGFQGVVLNISAAHKRSHPKKQEPKQRHLTDCELYSSGKRV